MGESRATMSSSSTSTMPTFANSDPLTLCTETLAVLTDQAKTKTYTTGVETYFSPDLSLTQMRERLLMFGSVSVRDYRRRPEKQINPATNQPFTDDFLTEQHKKFSAEREAHSKALNSLPYKPENKAERTRLNSAEQTARDWANFYRNMPAELANWRPQRLVALDLWVNHHKRAEYEATAKKHPADKFVQQIWSCIRQRCVAMDEANKERGNPMRNIHMALYFAPAQTYFSCDWETASPTEDKVFGHHATEYRLDDSGEVVCFQSNITIRRIEKEAQAEAKTQEQKRAEAEKKAEKEADYLASLTHHTDQWGHKFTQVGTKKATARYDEVWVLDDYTKTNEWCDLASVSIMEKVYSPSFLAVRTADTPTYSVFVCEAITTRHGNKKPVRTPALFTYRIEKRKSGKFVDENKTKQLRVSEKIDLSLFPKVA